MNLKKILGGVGALGSIVAAPFTAGTSLSWLPAALGAGGAAASLGGGSPQPPTGGANSINSSGWSMPGVTAPTFGAPAAAATGGATTTGPGATTGIMSRMGSILGSKALEGGVNAGLTLYGQKSQNKANDQARKDVLAAQAKEIELEEKRLALEASNANLDREDARALNAAIQALEAKKFALQQEQTAFERSVYERSEANMAPYRNVQGKALQRMSSILGL